MKRHTMLGFELFRGRPSLETAASIARSHHERWDGTGYPDGLAGEAITLCAHIVAVCDVYDALRSVRPYKRPWTHDETARFVQEGHGSQFDPAVVDAFFECEECIQGIHAELPDSTLTQAVEPQTGTDQRPSEHREPLVSRTSTSWEIDQHAQARQTPKTKSERFE
jgi:HD-GYP domain-containing protein (c-di-GMP phosphodiesterase class II)